MRAWPLLCAVLLLGGCNMVHTDHPLFTAKDAAGAPTFRPGVWADPDQGCSFDPNLPVKSWPDCAHGDAAPKAEPGATLLIVGGKPLIMQYGRKNPDDQPGSPPVYYYLGVEPSRLDSQGRIIAMKAWPVQCGPPPPPNPEWRKRRSQYGTRHPLSGMVMDPDGDNCTAATAEAVRAAAIPSRAWAMSRGAAYYWVRDGDQ